MLLTLAASDHATRWRLVPEKDVEERDGGLFATSTDPWLRLVPIDAPAIRRWIRIRYSTSLFDDPVRPLIRFRGPDGSMTVQPMNGPILGCAEWIGRVPDATETISISPVARIGPFGFRIDAIEPVSRRRLVRRGLSFDPGSLAQSFGAKIINAREERWESLKFASSATPFDDYHDWHSRLARASEPDGLDRPRADWRRAPAIRMVMALGDTGPDDVRATLKSLHAQAYSRWTLLALTETGAYDATVEAFRNAAAADGRLRLLMPDAPLELADGLAGDDALAAIGAGDHLPDCALAVLAETLASDPDARAVYGDEDAIDPDGVLHSPLFKPDWSPTWFGTTAYLGRLTALRAADVASLNVSAANFAHDEQDVVRRVVERAPPQAVRHIRRILYRGRRDRDTRRQTAPPARWPTRAVVVTEHALPEATIVIPSRDRPDLIGSCISTLRQHTDYPTYRIVIVDNGSTRPKSLRLLRELDALPDVEVIARPGPFNYSALCNDGARLTDTPLLAFLNNDVTVFEPGWLKALAGWAVQPGVGVVGAKLLFPNETLEHVGVVIGHGGLAGHMHQGGRTTDPGNMGRLLSPHEVSAVTGACIAIERAKFDAIGGFDAENLPIDLNDIDLCLKAAERGWRTIWTPEAVLYHRQSATRGYPLKPFTLYRKEREHFRSRWPHVIRDDPYFHPGLSLFSHRPALA